MRESNYSISCYLLPFSITLPPMKGSMSLPPEQFHSVQSWRKPLLCRSPTSFPLMSRSFKLTKSHSISVHCYLLLSEAVGKHFKQSVQEGDKTGRQAGEGREIKSLLAETMKKKCGSWWWWWWWWWRGRNLDWAKWNGTWEKCLIHIKEKNWLRC